MLQSLASVVVRTRRGMQLARWFCTEWMRYLQDRYVLFPAADYLPRRVAVCVASLLALADVALPVGGAHARWELRTVLGLGRVASFRLAWKRMAEARAELVDLRRVVRRRSVLGACTKIHLGGDEALRRLQAGEPLIIVTGHFAWPAILSLAPLATAAPVVVPASPLPERSISPFAMRARLKLGMLYAVPDVLAPATRVHIVRAGDVAGARVLARSLRAGGTALIAIDRPPVSGGALVRPFAAWAERRLPVGPVHLASLVGCPVTTCVAARRADGSMVFEWGPLHRPPCRGDAPGRLRMADQLFDELERGVGRHVEAYRFPLGYDRRWDHESESWTSLGETDRITAPALDPENAFGSELELRA